MPYIGRDLNRGNYLKLDDISSSFNSSTKTFNLTVGGSAFTPGSAFSILVSVGGVIQEPESAYQVNNSQITFANAPTAQDGFFCIALGVALGIGVPGSGTVNGPQMAKPFNYDGFFYLNDANNRVGINSSIPTASLDVIGNIKLNGNLVTGSGVGALQGNVYAASGISTFNDVRITNNLTVEGTTTTLDTNLIGVDRVEVGANSNTLAGIAVTQSGSADLVRLYDGSSQVVTVDDVGNVGVGSAIPAATVDIQGLSSSYPVLNIGGGGSTNGDLTVNSSESLQIGHWNRSTSTFEERLRIDPNGKLGIGTAVPDHSLHVYKEGGDSVITIESTGNGNHSALEFYRTSSGGNSKGGGSIYVTGDTSTSESKMKFGVGYNIGHGVFPRMTIEGANGRVGIGTENPTDILDVYSTTDPTIRSRSGSSSVGANIEICGGSSNDSQLILSSGTTNKYQFFRDGSQSDDLRIYDSANSLDIIRYRHGGYLHFGVNGEERLRIKSDGKVGIGTNNPTAEIDVEANTSSGYIAEFRQKHASNSGQIIIDTPADNNVRPASIDLANAGTVKWSLGQAYSSTSSGAFHIATSALQANQNGAKLTITTGGNIGIATANPTNKLSVVDGGIKVYGAATPNINFSPYGGNAGNGDISFDGTDLKIISNSSGANIRIGAYSKLNHIVIKANGHVGIHTDSPSNSTHLTIAGKSNYEAGIHYQQSNVSLYRFQTEGGTGHVYYDSYGINSGNDGDHIFRTKVSTGAKEILRIANAGEVKISTTGTNNVSAHLRLHCGDASIAASQAIGQIRFAGRDAGGTNVSRTGALIQATAAATWDTTQTSGYAASHLDFFTQNNSGTDTVAAGARVRIASSGQVNIGGNYDNPGEKLTVIGNISVGTRGDNNSRYIGKGTDATTLGTIGDASGNDNSCWIGFVSGTGTGYEDTITFGTHKSGLSGGERMKIAGDGNITIKNHLAVDKTGLETLTGNGFNAKLQVNTGSNDYDGLMLGGGYNRSTITTGGTYDLVLTSNAYPANATSNGIRFKCGSSGGGGPHERMRLTPEGELLLPGTQTVNDQTGMLDIYHTSPAEIDSPHIRLWGPTNQDARIEFGSETNNGEGGYISYNDSDEGLYIGSRMSGYSEVNICTGMNDGSPHSNVRLAVNNYGRTRHQNTTDFNREAYTKGGTVYGGGDATGKDQSNPGAYTFVNSTSVRGANTRYSFWVQSGDAYPNASNYLDFTVANAAMYRVLVKGSNSSDTADVAQFLIYGLANNDGQRPPVIEQLDSTPPSFNGDSGSYSPDFHRNSGSFSCIVKGFGTTGGTRGSTGTYDTTLRIQYSGNNNQGLVAFIERWDSGT